MWFERKLLILYKNLETATGLLFYIVNTYNINFALQTETLANAPGVIKMTLFSFCETLRLVNFGSSFTTHIKNCLA